MSDSAIGITILCASIMASASPVVDNILPLNPELLTLTPDESRFFKTLTGMQDDLLLKKHIISVQTKAYNSHDYPCIRLFNFTKLKISLLPAYNEVVRLRNTRPDAILLDAGCCFGNDLRKAVLDGWPVENTVGTDLEADFWKYGHELFQSSSETFPAGFVAGDIFSSEIIQPSEPFYDNPANPRPKSIRSLQSLTPLQGHVSVVHASSLFHIFDEKKQAELAGRLASLLSPEPGSIIFGSHGGLPRKGTRRHSPKFSMFCHGPESWKDLWDGQVFHKGTVHVQVQVKPLERVIRYEKEDQFYLMTWSVMRL